jgi:two-component system alkaline phosphatase synthesis response regulator PhoP
LSDFETPIIFVTARNTGEDRIKGLKLGGDDYLTKPFEYEELELRIQKLLQRSGKAKKEETSIYTFGNNEVNFKTFEAHGLQGAFMLTKKEAMLLKLLIDRKNQVVSRRQILQSVWGYDVFPSTRTIDNFILSFRKYFEEDPKNPKYFISVRGVGYKFLE